MTDERSADLVLQGGTVLRLDRASTTASAIAISGDRIARVGGDADIAPLIGPATRVIDLAGRTAMPGLTDGHAHLDREGLKSLLPSLAGCRTIEAVVERIRGIARRTPAGEWVVTMPLGEPPEYAWSNAMYEEGRLPDRHDLDRATGAHPVLVRCAWGYWPGVLPIVSIANSAALALAGIGRETQPPSPLVQIERGSDGEPTGRIFENAFQPIAEFTLFRQAPHFTADDRVRSLVTSMRAYNAYGTTAVFEGHGVADEVIDAYRRIRAADRQTVRARLVFSPGWSGASEADVDAWVRTEAKRLACKGEGDDWVRLAGLFTEVATQTDEARLRARCHPRTGWAGFRYDMGLPPPLMAKLLAAAARERLRVCGIQAGMLAPFVEAARRAPIDDLRWVIAHPATLDAEQIARIRDHGIVVTTLTSNYIWRRASAVLKQIGEDRADTLCPIRSLLDAGVPVALATDNVPISLWPSAWHATERIDRATNRVIAPGQRITREEALRCMTVNGAWLCMDEDERGTLQPGRLADVTVLPENPLTIAADRLASLAADLTLVGGRVVWDAAREA